MMNKMEEDDNEKRKEIGLIKNQLQKVCIYNHKKNIIGRILKDILFDIRNVSKIKSFVLPKMSWW